MTVRSPFKPHYGTNQVVTPNGTSATITIGKGDKTLRIRNTGATNVMFFRTGIAADGAVVATTADVPVSPGETVYIEKPMDHDTLAGISAAGTTCNVMSGEGGF